MIAREIHRDLWLNPAMSNSEPSVPKTPCPSRQETENLTDARSGSESQPSTPPPEKQKLTDEEQLALYEKELKENDWGHQPC